MSLTGGDSTTRGVRGAVTSPAPGMRKKTDPFGIGSVLCVLLLCLQLPPERSNAAQELLGRPIPVFEVTSGIDERIQSTSLSGKVVVMFYETRDAARRNSEIKDLLNEIYDRQPETIRRLIVRLPVFNFAGVVWPLTVFYKKQLHYHSQRVRMSIYADWDGKILKDFQFIDNESNMVMIDKKGVIRFYAQGKIERKRIGEIQDLLRTMVAE
jgi:predicted transcriptional regulator